MDVKQLERGTHKERMVKMKRLRVIQEAIYQAAAKGDISAAKEFNDRVLGKSPQSIVGDEDEAPVQVQNIDSILDKAYGDAE